MKATRNLPSSIKPVDIGFSRWSYFYTTHKEVGKRRDPKRILLKIEMLFRKKAERKLFPPGIGDPGVVHTYLADL
jgi:hypothetical protein